MTTDAQADWQTTPALARIERAVADVPGWTPIDQLYTLFNVACIGSATPGDILEIGSWCGRSTTVLGMAARLTLGTQVVCIDLFPERGDWKQNADGSYSFAVTLNGRVYGGYQEQTVWKEPFEQHHAKIYDKYAGILDAFNENIAKNGLADLVTAHRGDSDLLRDYTGRTFRMAFLDGDHSYDAVCKDIRNVDRVLAPGGWVCFDDAYSTYTGVDRAIRELIIDDPGYELGQQMTRKLFMARKKVR